MGRLALFGIFGGPELPLPDRIQAGPIDWTLPDAANTAFLRWSNAEGRQAFSDEWHGFWEGAGRETSRTVGDIWRGLTDPDGDGESNLPSWPQLGLGAVALGGLALYFLADNLVDTR